jgi:hypothetical protein
MIITQMCARPSAISGLPWPGMDTLGLPVVHLGFGSALTVHTDCGVQAYGGDQTYFGGFNLACSGSRMLPVLVLA